MTQSLEALFDELIAMQEKKLLEYGAAIIPNITPDDILQPNDYPELENHPEFRYEEGYLKGLHAAKMAAISRAE
ncbi:hypothetical protein [Candidatus Neptunochlamydia vexilliferae]|uniref:hypothetical protein n=1 Tax=Candidatus Neptunichlamydia vexilliferae TaxID=1651774 RepID=UPI0018919AF4|nr:hypothetical protein [Candidatus Neptunochlamydia vexilliferae]